MINSKYQKAFAAYLSQYLKDNNLSASQLAKQVGIPHQTISRYLSCKHLVNIDILCKFADYFGETLDILLGRSEY